MLYINGYWSNCNVLYINGFVSMSSTNLRKACFKSGFKILAENKKNIQKNSKAWILIKLQCVIYVGINGFVSPLSFEKSLSVATFRNKFRLSVCTTIFKRIAGLCFYLKCLMLLINVFALTSWRYKLMESFFQSSNLFLN